MFYFCFWLLKLLFHKQFVWKIAETLKNQTLPGFFIIYHIWFHLGTSGTIWFQPGRFWNLQGFSILWCCFGPKFWQWSIWNRFFAIIFNPCQTAIIETNLIFAIFHFLKLYELVFFALSICWGLFLIIRVS